MINKLKQKIRNKLIMFLGIDELNKNLQNYKIENNGRVSSCEVKSQFHAQILNKHDSKIEAIHNTLSSVVSMGSDIYKNRYGGSSWAVVCIEGKYNIVKFLDLSTRDADDILKVLKNFEGGRYVNDTPIGYFPKDMFIDWKK